MLAGSSRGMAVIFEKQYEKMEPAVRDAAWPTPSGRRLPPAHGLRKLNSYLNWRDSCTFIHLTSTNVLSWILLVEEKSEIMDGWDVGEAANQNVETPG
ncbi:uncharacterized protein CCOS01_16194 [Colletotrichum costaricense]|uniref:Uncharacterized protein n=1 Tax=Colletotrichum costaricense TaxID=1209916 RepID=A0AAI9YFW4_9PEZI|nr:uncharacterized protein CCOS01_16194 [Colletotrichum costaricense]KAK1507888.1 hypothetical protein CCOS01_16194 [Colletotrichum costaricense]